MKGHRQTFSDVALDNQLTNMGHGVPWNRKGENRSVDDAHSFDTVDSTVGIYDGSRVGLIPHWA